jgi:CcmD family protein
MQITPDISGELARLHRNFNFLVLGYSAALLVVIGFVFLLVRRGRRIDRELSRLKDQVTEKDREQAR